MRPVVSILCGSLFGFGLAASGMTSREKVLGFLDMFGAWIPDLLFVMAGALLVKALSYHFLIKHRKPLFAPSLDLPLKSQVDRNLVIGAAIFGIGWGVYGYCPGPALSALAYLDEQAAAFVGAMVLGMFFASLVGKKSSA